jgi:hypothetical protein
MKKKLTLSKTEQLEYKINAKRLMAAGVISCEDEPSSEPQILTLEQTGGPGDSFLNALPVRGYDILVWVRIVAQKSHINFLDCQLIPRKWADDGIHLVEAAEGRPYYKGLAGDEYQESDILNGSISSDRYLDRGDVLKGAVFLQSFGPLPVWLVDGISIEADLYLEDQFENVSSLKVDLRVVRDERSVERPERTGLFGPNTRGTSPGREGVSAKQSTAPQPSLRVHQ